MPVDFPRKAVKTSPPEGDKYKITNLYVEITNGEPKLKIEYEDESI